MTRILRSEPPAGPRARWTRAFSGALALAATPMLAVLWYGILTAPHPPSLGFALVTFISAPYGCYVFGHYAVTGRLPRQMRPRSG